MLAPVRKRMSLEEFLTWDDGTDRRFQLIGGEPCAVSPAPRRHRWIIAALLSRLHTALAAPYRVESEAGIRLPHRDDAYFLADIAVSCTPSEGSLLWIPDPVLIVEVLSPSTEAEDRRVKLPEYRQLASVRDIVYLASETCRAEVWSRDAAGRFGTVRTVTDGALHLPSVELTVDMADLYR